LQVNNKRQGVKACNYLAEENPIVQTLIPHHLPFVYKPPLSMLRAGNRNMEKKLYPNRWERYARRLVRFTGRAAGNIRDGITNSRQRRRTRRREWENPVAIFSRNGKISDEPKKGRGQDPLQKQSPAPGKQTIPLLPRKQNRQRAAEEERKKGMGL